MNILSIDEIISRYSHSVKKAERLNTTGNRHYEEKKSVIYYLKLLMSYISPGGALAVANPGEYMPESDIFLSPVHEAAYKARVGECEAGNITDNAAATDGSITINSATLTNECNRLLFDSINAALGIELMEWQKVYILTGRKARQGEATALALRQLLNNTAQPIDLTDKAAGYYFAGTDEELDDYRKLIINMHDRLDNAGIPVRRILKDEQEFEEYLKPLKSIAVWFDMVVVHNGDYEREEYGDR
jgi:hypothetical protein